MKKQILKKLFTTIAFILMLALLMLLCGCNTSDTTETIPSVSTLIEIDTNPNGSENDNKNNSGSIISQNGDGNIYLPGAENTKPDTDNSVEFDNTKPASDSDTTQPYHSYIEPETIGENEIDFAELP